MPGLPGVVMTRQGPLGAFTAKIREVMSETGKVLGDSGQLRLSPLVFLGRVGLQQASLKWKRGRWVCAANADATPKAPPHPTPPKAHKHASPPPPLPPVQATPAWAPSSWPTWTPRQLPGSRPLLPP